MALQKEIILENGIKVNYHRIVNTSILVNKSITIEVGSYIDNEQRNKEKQVILNNYETEDTDIFIHTTYIEMEYKEEINIEEVYNYLKTTELFKNSLDV